MKKKIVLALMSLMFLAPIVGKFYSMFTYENQEEHIEQNIPDSLSN